MSRINLLHLNMISVDIHEYLSTHSTFLVKGLSNTN